MTRSLVRYAAMASLAVMLFSSCLGCPAGSGGYSAADGSAPAVRINGQEIPYREFEAYLKASFGEEEPAADAVTRSRLLDQFIEERLLLQEAKARKVRVSDAQVDAYLASLGVGASGEKGNGRKPIDKAFRDQVRQNLLIQEFKDRVLLREVRVEPKDIEAYFNEHPEEFREARVVILRQILLDSAEEARKVLAALKEDPGQFQLLATRHSAAPDKGEPRPYQEEELPDSIRTMVFSLQPGEVSGIVEEGGKYRLFQSVEQHAGKSLGLEESRKKIEVLLLQKKIEETLSRALAEIRRAAKIEVHVENLPFAYSGEYRG